ncbi:peptidoglycan-binding protein [Streptomyces sp. NPDC005438]|uniref:peptidoglycan-binding domain-containing protein n=1 Tax=Streptomyces sp. NPDC005438 TaxID=3156880 RepID=UPI0033AA6A11
MTAPQDCPICLAPLREGAPTCECSGTGGDRLPAPARRRRAKGPNPDDVALFDELEPQPTVTDRGLRELAVTPLASAPGRRRLGTTLVPGGEPREPRPERPASARRGRRRVWWTLTAVLAVAALTATVVDLGGGGDSTERTDRAETVVPDKDTSYPTPPPPSQPTRGGPSTSPSDSVSPTASESPEGNRSPGGGKVAAPGGGASSASPTRSSAEPTPDDPTPTSSAPTQKPPPVLEEGDKGAEVAELQRRLKELGFFTGEDNGRFGPSLTSAVTAFQRAYDVKGDPKGVYGAHTRKALEKETEGARPEEGAEGPGEAEPATSGEPAASGRAVPLG